MFHHSARRGRPVPPQGSLGQWINNSDITILPALASVDLSKRAHGASFPLLTPDEVSHELASLQAILSEAEDSTSPRTASKRSTPSRKSTKEPARNASKASIMSGSSNDDDDGGDKDISRIRTRLVQGSLARSQVDAPEAGQDHESAGSQRRGSKPRSRTPSKRQTRPESLNDEGSQLCPPGPSSPPNLLHAPKEPQQGQSPNEHSPVGGPRRPSKASTRTPSKASARAGSKLSVRIPSKGPVRPESPNERPPDMKWHVMLLGRTFRDKTQQETADCLAEVFEISVAEAAQKVACANVSTTFVVGTCEDCMEADAKAQQLRSKGLRVQVASEAGLPVSDGSRTPRTPKKDSQVWGPIEPCNSKNSYDSIFRDADPDHVLSPKRPSRPNSVSSHSVVEKDDRPRLLSLPSLLPDSNEPLDGEDAQSKKVPLSRLQASVLINFLITGNYHTFFKRVTPKGGTVSKREVRVLCQFWMGLDEDRSNDIDRVEFQHYADPNLLSRYQVLSREQMDSLPEWARMSHSEKASKCGIEGSRFIPRMREKMVDALFGNKQSFDLVGLLGLANPFASATSLKSLVVVFHEIFAAEFSETRARTPPVLDIDAYQDLCAVFEGFDKDQKGVLSIPDLANQGLIQEDQIVDLRQKLGCNGDDLFDVAKFCEVMCPCGYRATEQSRVATMEDGRKLVLAPHMEDGIHTGTETWSWEAEGMRLRGWSCS